MNKNDLITAVSDSASITKAQAAETVDAVFSTISNELSSGGEVRLVGFGTFVVTNRAALREEILELERLFKFLHLNNRSFVQEKV